MPAAGAAIDAAIWAGLPPAASAFITADAVGAILPATGFAAAAICIAPELSAPASGDDPADSAIPAIPGNSFMGPLAFYSRHHDTCGAVLLHIDVRNINFEIHLRRDTLHGFFCHACNRVRQQADIRENQYFPRPVCFFLGGDSLSITTGGAIITACFRRVHTCQIACSLEYFRLTGRAFPSLPAATQYE
ncbi:hypothetical protein [Burkholderia stabilis]|uniref:hypothetical protein n=1 Tax=Burkholderia stabilis TaxID=95485 RepID=UPI0013CE5863|nr:hypothetical protein [Burkholderia stabilis]